MRMKVDLLWDGRFPGVREPLYLIWLGIGTAGCSWEGVWFYWLPLLFVVPRPLPISRPAPQVKRRDSEGQLQSLVARVQCGDWPPVVTSLLRDRLKGAGSEATEAGPEAELLPRSIYRETLFLNVTISAGHFDIGKPYTG